MCLCYFKSLYRYRMDDKSPVTSVIILEGSEAMEKRRLRWVLQAYLKGTELR